MMEGKPEFSGKKHIQIVQIETSRCFYYHKHLKKTFQFHFAVLSFVQGVRLHRPVGDASHCADLCHRILDLGDEQILYRMRNRFDLNVGPHSTFDNKHNVGFTKYEAF